MRRAGWQASLATVFTNPRLADFAAGCTPPTEPVVTGPVLTHDDENALEPFDLTEVQRAYLVGRDPGLVLGGVDCIFYREYRVESLMRTGSVRPSTPSSRGTRCCAPSSRTTPAGVASGAFVPGDPCRRSGR